MRIRRGGGQGAAGAWMGRRCFAALSMTERGVLRVWLCSAILMMAVGGCRRESEDGEQASTGDTPTITTPDVVRDFRSIDKSACELSVEIPPVSVPEDRREVEQLAAEANARGIALLTAGKVEEALAEFRKVQTLVPDRIEGVINEAIVYAHQGSPECRNVARTMFERVLVAHPGQPHALYNLSILAEELPESDAYERMLDHAKRFVDVVPEDAFGHYLAGKALQNLDRREEALQEFKTSIELDPEFIPGHQGYGSMLMQVRREDAEAQQLAREHLLKVRELNTWGKSARFFASGYTEHGRYAEAMALYGLGDTAQIAASEAPMTFEDLSEELPDTGVEEGGERSDVALGLVWLDVNGDERMDLFVPGGKGRGCRLWINASAPAAQDEGGVVRFEDASELWGVASLEGVHAAVAGDWDRDGDVDVITSGETGGRLLVNTGEVFVVLRNSDEGPLPPARGQPSLEDIDHDGDEDLYWPGVIAEAAADNTEDISNLVFRNVVPREEVELSAAGGELGAFTPSPAEWDLGQELAGVYGVLWTDVDRDVDTDGVVFGEFEPGVAIFENRRERGFVRADERLEMEGDGFVAGGAALGDLDNNGRLDLVLGGVDARPLRILLNRDGRYVENGGAISEWPVTSEGEFSADGLTLVDLDNDGDLDVVVVYPTGDEAAGFAILENDGAGKLAFQMDSDWRLPGQARVVTTADADVDGRMDLAFRLDDGRVRLWRNTTANGFRGVQVNLARSRASDGSWKFSCPVGAKVLLRKGRYAQLRRRATATGFMAQSSPLVHFGLGPASETLGERDCALEILWTSGTIQGVADCPFGSEVVTTIREVDVRVASCPFLFVWDGRRYRFMGDVLAASPPGLYVAPGVYAQCDPDEYIRIPRGLIGLRDGRYDFVVHECLREVAYLDQMELVAIDHDEGVAVYPNERFSGPPPFPEEKLFTVRAIVAPSVAVDQDGRDCSEELRKPDDGRSVNDFRHLTLPGFAEEHAIELAFEEIPGDRPLVLLLHGYLKFPGSPVQYVAAEQGLRFEMPRLERQRPDGSWELIHANIGAPAGFPRTMTVGLEPGMLSGSERLRITTNICVYWDWVGLGVVAPHAELRVTRLKPDRAELGYTGFPRFEAPAVLGQPEHYDYADRALIDQPLEPGLTYRWPKMTGRYTRFGDVRELMEAADDRYAIFGAGEQVHLQFDAGQLPALEAGRARTVLVLIDGWVKDNYHQTATSATVEPLPYHGMENYPEPAGESFPWTESLRRWDETYNRRMVSDNAAF